MTLTNTHPGTENKDISAKISEKATIKELERYKAFIGASEIGAWEYFTESEFLWCNDIYFKLLGRDIKDFDMSGRSNLKSCWVDLLHPEDKETAVNSFYNVLSNPKDTFESYFRMLHSNGSWVWMWSRGSVFRDGDNEEVAVIGTLADITRHKNAEEIIQRERIMLRTLIDNLPDTIYVKDIEGRKIIANRADVECIGAATEEDVLGKTDLELFNNDIGRRGYADDMRAMKTGLPIINNDEYFLDAAGKMRWLQTTKIPIRNEHGEVIRLLGIGHDVTLRRESDEKLKKLNKGLKEQSEQLREKAEDLKVLNRQLEEQKEQQLEKAIAQGKFEIASEFLHDIGNAMVGLGAHLNRINQSLGKNNLDNLKSLSAFLKTNEMQIAEAIGANKAGALVSITDGIVSEQAVNGADIQKSVTELLNIITHIQEILNIQRQLVKNHKGMQERKPVDMETIIYDCRSMLFAAIDKKGIQVKVNIKPGKYTIIGDHTKLMQVILNILKNSIEAIDPNAEEKIISIDMSTGDVLQLTITDNGSGFSEQTASLFFVRGFTTKKSGTGLGLYNCRTIIESHIGSFDIKSPGPGLGATTTIKFSL